MADMQRVKKNTCMPQKEVNHLVISYVHYSSVWCLASI